MSVLTPHRPADLPRQPDRLLAGAPAPIVLAYGIGVDSTVCGESIGSYGDSSLAGHWRPSGTINLIRRIGSRFLDGIRESISDSCPDYSIL
jgi:hypothetical protein